MSPEQFGNIFTKSVVGGLFTGIWLFFKSGGWFILLCAILGSIWGSIRKKRKR